jgi:hypothetical protein
MGFSESGSIAGLERWYLRVESGVADLSVGE